MQEYNICYSLDSNYSEQLAVSITSILKNADITMINQEFPFSLRGTKMEDKQYTFRTEPQYIKVMEEMGVDISD